MLAIWQVVEDMLFPGRGVGLRDDLGEDLVSEGCRKGPGRLGN